VALALEYEEVLKRGDLISAMTDENVDRFLDYIFQSSNLVPSVYPMRPTLSDPDDELVLDVAIQCGAVIVTCNTTLKGKQWGGQKPPRKFLLLLLFLGLGKVGCDRGPVLLRGFWIAQILTGLRCGLFRCGHGENFSLHLL
jgi:hypothetical protein